LQDINSGHLADIHAYLSTKAFLRRILVGKFIGWKLYVGAEQTIRLMIDRNPENDARYDDVHAREGDENADLESNHGETHDEAEPEHREQEEAAGRQSPLSNSRLSEGFGKQGRTAGGRVSPGTRRA
jgi:hypothetical protein